MSKTNEERKDYAALGRAMALVDSLGPFHEDPCIDRAYKALRIAGCSREETINLIKSGQIVCKSKEHPHHII